MCVLVCFFDDTQRYRACALRPTHTTHTQKRASLSRAMEHDEAMARESELGVDSVDAEFARAMAAQSRDDALDVVDEAEFAKAMAAKAKGNAAFSAGQLSESSACYDEAVRCFGGRAGSETQRMEKVAAPSLHHSCAVGSADPAPLSHRPIVPPSHRAGKAPLQPCRVRARDGAVARRRGLCERGSAARPAPCQIVDAPSEGSGRAHTRCPRALPEPAPPPPLTSTVRRASPCTAGSSAT